MLTVRKATADDIEYIMSIYAQARGFMIRSGNPTQWGDSYPKRELIEEDIRGGISRVICDGEAVRGVFALLTEEDPTYKQIEDGSWLNDSPYVTIHRIASDGVSRGIFRCAAGYCKSISRSVRVDTHADNAPMRRRIEENGFVRCGIIHIADGSPRIAYQWIASQGGFEPVLESERMLFVRPSETLIADYILLMNDFENVGRFIRSGPPAQSARYDETHELAWVRKTREENAQAFSLIEKSSGDFIGNIELMGVTGAQAELGIALTAKKQNAGFGTEAVSALTSYGFGALGLERIFLRTNPKNARAICVYTRCGFREYDRADGHLYMELFK